MQRRRGYQNFIRKIEGKPTRQSSTGSRINLPMPPRFNDMELMLNARIEPECLVWIMETFTWSESPQGARFWNEIYDGNGDQEYACTILRNWRAQLSEQT